MVYVSVKVVKNFSGKIWSDLKIWNVFLKKIYISKRRQRENPTSNKVLKCVHGTNNCEINVENRTHCRKCRLDKCLKLGMKLNGKFASIAFNYQIQTDSTINDTDKNNSTHD